MKIVARPSVRPSPAARIGGCRQRLSVGAVRVGVGKAQRAKPSAIDYDLTTHAHASPPSLSRSLPSSIVFVAAFLCCLMPRCRRAAAQEVMRLESL